MKSCPFTPSPNTSEWRWTDHSRIADTSSNFTNSWHLSSHSWGSLLGCCSNNAANSHPSPGAFNCRVLRSCMVLCCSHPLHWPCHQWCLANCDWMPASYTTGQPSNPRRHPTCWASSQTCHTVSSTLCYGAWTPAPLGAQLSRVQMHGVSNRDTHLYLPHSYSSVHLATEVWHSGRITNGMRSEYYETPCFHPWCWHPHSKNGPPLNSMGPALTASTPVFLLARMGYGLLCSLWVWCRRTNSWPCWLHMSNPSASTLIARPNSSGQ